MKTRKILSMALAIIMAFALVPVMSFAEGMGELGSEAAAMAKLDNVWAQLEKAEAEAMSQKLTRTEVINAVYAAALNNGLVDKDSFADFSKDGFFFTVDGMYCSYDYRLRNEIDMNAAPIPEDEMIVRIEGKGNASKDATSPNVFLIAPYYGHDSSFTDQYKLEAQSIADATGGEYLLIQSTAATGPAIAENFTDKGTVIFDSHGTQSGSSSYLCLTTKTGITQEDFSNGWAVNAGSAAYIDGRYIQNHVDAELSDCMVWMAICEGMKRQGQGTTGTALLAAGAGVVYGYSQSVTFGGDYAYEEVFWNVMKEGGTVAEAFEAMTDQYGYPEPYGDAYPIVMSPVDEFPANPDSPQTVYCEWTLFGEAEPVALESFTLSANSVELYAGHTTKVEFGRVPDNANQYELVWESADESIATVNGNNRRANITGVNPGNTVVTCTVMVNGQVFGTATVAVNITIDTSLYDSLNVEGGSLIFSTGANLGFTAIEEGDRFYAESGNAGQGGSTSTLTTTIEMEAGETLVFDYFYSSEDNYDWFTFKANGEQLLRKSGESEGWDTYTYTATANGEVTFEWSYTKDGSIDRNEDCVRIDNVAFSGDEGATPDAGDIDGDGTVTVQDAILAIQASVGLIELTEDQLALADVDGDGTIGTNDGLAIIRIAIGL